MQRNLKKAVRRWVPPAVWELASRLAHRHIGADNPQQREKSKDWYDAYYSQFRNSTQHYASSPYYFMYAVLADRILRSRISSVLEVGCGRGRFAAVLHQLGFTRYVGFDFSREQLDAARRTCPELQFYFADAFSTDLFDAVEYDAVVCTEFLEHVDNDLDIIRRVPKGIRFFGSVPSFDFVSHVRCFADSHEVEKRYGPLLSEFEVARYCFRTGDQFLYLFEGTTT